MNLSKRTLSNSAEAIFTIEPKQSRIPLLQLKTPEELQSLLEL